MLSKFFNSFRKLSADDFITELLKPTFYEDKIETIYNNYTINLNWQNKDGDGYLHLCAKNNLTESIAWLLSKGCNLEHKNKDKETALFIAAKNNNIDAVEELISYKANLEDLNINNRTALQEAILSNSVNVIDLLLKNTKNLNNLDINGHNLLFNATSSGNETIISKVIKTCNLDLNQKDSTGRNILLQKFVVNKNFVALELMELGANPTLKDNRGKDFLFYAISRGMDAEVIIDKAISLGCDINSTTKDGTTVLIQVLYFLEDLKENDERRGSFIKLVKKFINLDADLNLENDKGDTALYLISKLNDIELLIYIFLNKRVDINYQNRYKETVFDKLMFLGIKYLEVLKYLLDNGIDTKSRDLKNRTSMEKFLDIILHIKNGKVIEQRFIKNISLDGDYFLLLKELLETEKIDLNVLNSKGKPLFFDTIFYRNDVLFKLLKEYDLNLNLKDEDKNNILNNLMLEAVKTYSYDEKSYLGMLKRMLGLGVDVNSRDKSGGTSVHKAIIESCEKTLKLLLEESKADLKAVDNNGRNLAHSCVWKGKTKHFVIVHSYDNNILNEADNFGILPINYAAFMGHRELVIKMIDSGAFINNPNSKNKKMLQYLSQYNKNLVSLYQSEDTELNKKNIRMLIKNMKDEFQAEG